MFDGSSNGILGTFSNKIRLAHAIEVINQVTYKDLLLINDIRNVFAHTLHSVSFKNDLVKKDCVDLTIETNSPPQDARKRYLARIQGICENCGPQ